MEEFTAAFGKFYDGTRAGTKECLYYGFVVHVSTVHCGEAYKNAAGVLRTSWMQRHPWTLLWPWSVRVASIWQS